MLQTDSLPPFDAEFFSMSSTPERWQYLESYLPGKVVRLEPYRVEDTTRYGFLILEHDILIYDGPEPASPYLKPLKKCHYIYFPELLTALTAWLKTVTFLSIFTLFLVKNINDLKGVLIIVFGQKVSFSGLYTWLRNIPPTGPDTHKIIQSL